MVNVDFIINLIDSFHKTEDPRMLVRKALITHKIDSEKSNIISLDWGIDAIYPGYFRELNLNKRERTTIQIILGIFENYTPNDV